MLTRSTTILGLVLVGAGIAASACGSKAPAFIETATTGTGGHTTLATIASTGTSTGGAGTTTSTSTTVSGTTTAVTSSSGHVSTTSGATTTTTSAASSTTSSAAGGPCTALPAAPQVMNFGGPTLMSPKVYPVFFSNDDPTTVASLTDFTTKITTTSYWTSAVGEYGIGQGMGMPAIKLAETSTGTIDDSAIQSWLSTKFAAGAPFPAPDANTLIVLYYPAGTNITLQNNQSCQSFGGYHNGAVLGNGQEIAYAVVPRCPGQGVSDLDEATSAASHEIAEAATDPYPMDHPAYAQVDDSHLDWEYALGGGEVGDMCAQFPGAFQSNFPGLPYRVQRIWSNQAASAGKEPCQPPAVGENFVGAAPVLPDMVTVNFMGQSASFPGVTIPVGQSKTISLDIFGPAAASGQVQAVDLNAIMGGSPLLGLNVTQNGCTGTLDIKVNQQGQGGVEAFFLIAGSPLTNTSPADIWVGIVQN